MNDIVSQDDIAQTRLLNNTIYNSVDPVLNGIINGVIQEADLSPWIEGGGTDLDAIISRSVDDVVIHIGDNVRILHKDPVSGNVMNDIVSQDDIAQTA